MNQLIASGDDLLPATLAEDALHRIEVLRSLRIRAGIKAMNLNAVLLAQGKISTLEYAWALYEFRDNPKVANNLLCLKEEFLNLARCEDEECEWGPESLLEIGRVVTILLWMRQASKAEALKERNCISSVAKYALDMALCEYRGPVADRIPLYFLRFELCRQVASDAKLARDSLRFVAELIPLIRDEEARSETSYMLAVKYLELWHPIEAFRWWMKSIKRA